MDDSTKCVIDPWARLIGARSWYLQNCGVYEGYEVFSSAIDQAYARIWHGDGDNWALHR
jgi:hypothetical protein